MSPGKLLSFSLGEPASSADGLVLSDDPDKSGEESKGSLQ